MARSDWTALLAAAVQIAYRHDTRLFLPLAKGLARQTTLDPDAYSGQLRIYSLIHYQYYWAGWSDTIVELDA